MASASNRARTPSNRGCRKVIGRFPSQKRKEMVWSEGSLERDYIRILELDSNVTGYQEQPMLIRHRFWPNGVVRLITESDDDQEPELPPEWKVGKYYPDLYVERKDRPPLLVEVKNTTFLDDPTVKRKLTAGHLFAQSQGWEFQVITEDIRRGPLLQSARILQRYQRLKVPYLVRLGALKHLQSVDSRLLSVRELSATLEAEGHGSAETLGFVYSLIGEGVLGVELGDRVLGPDTTVKLGGVRLGVGSASQGRVLSV